MAEVSTKVVTGKVRLSYAHVWEPQAAPGSTEKKYSCAILISKKDKATLAKINGVIDALKEEVKQKNKGKLPAKFRTPLRDGDDEDEANSQNSAYQGCFFLNASSKTQPGMIDKAGNKIVNRDELYSGCYAHVSLNFFAYDNVGAGISAGLNNIMKIEDGEPLAGRSSAEDDFADLIGGDDDEDLF